MTYVRNKPARSRHHWRPEEIETLRKMFNEKELVSVMAKRLGRTTKATQAALVKFDIEKRLQSQIRFEKPQAVVKSRIIDYSQAPKGSTPLIDAKPRQCRWPVGLTMKNMDKGSGHFVCGCKTASYDIPYCEKHMNKAYQAGTAIDLTGLGDKFS